MVQIKNKITAALLLTLLLNSVQAEEEAKSKCESGKCVLCVDDKEAGIICAACYQSVLSPDFECIGSSTNLENCVVNSFSGTGMQDSPESSCQVCNLGYYSELDSNGVITCPKNDITNCFSQSNIFRGKSCDSCKNGFTFNDSDECLAVIEPLPNCLGVVNNFDGEAVCQFCEPEYVTDSDGGCKKRETKIEQYCTGGTGEETEAGVYCNGCYFVKGYFSVGVREGSPGSFTQLCAKYLELMRIGTQFFALLIWGMYQ